MEDIAEKRKKLEVIRAARVAKQRVIEQYTTARMRQQEQSSLIEPVSLSPSQNQTADFAFMMRKHECSAGPHSLVGSALTTGPIMDTMHLVDDAFPLARTGIATPPPLTAPSAAVRGGCSQAYSPQGLEHLYRWGSRPHDTSAGAPRIAAICALTPKLCLGTESRLVVDVGVTTLPYTGSEGGGGTAATFAYPSPDTHTAAALLDPFPCIAAAYTARSSVASQQDASMEAAAVVFRPTENALMARETSFQWGHAGGTTTITQDLGGAAVLDAVGTLLRQASGLVLTWTLIPGLGSDKTDGVSVDQVTAPLESGSQDLVVVTPLLCEAEVSVLLAHPFRRGVFIAGTDNGRLVMWNMAAVEWVSMDRGQLRRRALATTGSTSVLLWHPQRPCASSFPSPHLHQGRLLALSIHGDASSHHLYSISQDGRVCTWPAWRFLQPTTVRTAYVEGSCPMNYSGAVAAFANQRGTDAMTKVYVGTTSGTVLVGSNRDSCVVELVPCSVGAGQAPRRTALPQSGAHAALGSSAASETLALPASLVSTGTSGKLSLALCANSPDEVAFGALTSTASRTSLTVGLKGFTGHGRVTAIAAQPSGADTFCNEQCFVAAFADGFCAVYAGDAVVTMEGFAATVTALCWSPLHLAIFAAGDAAGVVSLWDVYGSVSASLVSVHVHRLTTTLSGWPAVASGEGVVATGVAAILSLVGDVGGDEFLLPAAGVAAADADTDVVAAAVTALHFSADGRWLFTGVAAGSVYVLELSPELCDSCKGKAPV